MLKFVNDNDKLNLTTPTINIGSSADLSDYYTKGETDAAIDVAISEIVFPEPDLSEYAKKSEIPSLDGYALKSDIPTDYLTEIPEEYVTEEELNAKGYLTEHQSLEGYAKTTDIPDVSGFATKDYVDNAVNNIPEVDLSGYALKSEIPDVSGFLTAIPEEYVTESELNAKGYLTEHQSLADYSTTTQVQNMIDTAIAGITDGEAVSY